MFLFLVCILFVSFGSLSLGEKNEWGGGRGSDFMR